MPIESPYYSKLQTHEAVPKKQWSSDFDEPGFVHRDVLYADRNQLVDITPGRHPPTSWPDKTQADPACQFLRNGASMVRLRVWGATNAAADTVTFAVFLFPKTGRIATPGTEVPGQVAYNGTGIQIASIVGTLSFGTLIIDVHPVTGEATPGLVWYEMSGAALTIIHTDVVKELDDESTYQTMILLDFLSFAGMYIEPTAISSSDVTRVVFELTRVA